VKIKSNVRELVGRSGHVGVLMKTLRRSDIPDLDRRLIASSNQDVGLVSMSNDLIFD